MRVITGSARGRKLKAPANYDIRPTSDNVKEAVFNIIQFDIEGRRVLDLFAGTGQIGIESLSRGADSAVFVDRDKTAAELVRENLKVCGLKGTVIQQDSLLFLNGCGKFDIIYIDPPYDMNLYEPALKIINSVDILSEGGIIIVEARRSMVMPEMTSPYRKIREYHYGSVKICTYTRESE